MDEIVNKVAASGLIAVDLAEYQPAAAELAGFDFAPYLWNGLVLREKEFRAFLSGHDWLVYKDKHVYLFCSAEAILPSWAYMLVTSRLVGIASSVVVGTAADARQAAMQQRILSLDTEAFRNGKLIVKGCSDIPNPEGMMSLFLQKVQPVCSSLMYGEPCSTVPVYKRPKNVS